MILGVIGLIFAGNPALAVDEWNIANQATMAWDPVTIMGGASPIPPGDLIEYEVYWVKAGLPKDAVDLLAPIGTISETQFTYTFTEESDYILGVRAIRIPQDNPGLRLPSGVSWSDNYEAVFEEKTFGVRYYMLPSNVIELRPLIQ